MRSRDWPSRNKSDIYVEKAKKEGYLSRSAYKLIEIEKKYKIILNSSNILELGSSPGGWSQVVCDFNKQAKIDAFDLLRKGEPEFKELNLADKSKSEDEILEAMIKFPKLIERPIVISEKEAILGRPPENVLKLLY